MPKTELDVVICAGCGRPIEKYKSTRDPGERAVEVRIGKLLQSQTADGKRRPGRPRTKVEKFKAEKLWGVMHLNCFVKSLESPDDVFAQLSGANVR